MRGFRKPNDLGFPEHKAMDFLQVPESLKLPFHIYDFFFPSGFRFTGMETSGEPVGKDEFCCSHSTSKEGPFRQKILMLPMALEH